MDSRTEDCKTKKISYYWGFPIDGEQADSQNSRGRKQGVAMLVALFVTSMAMLFLTEMKVSTSVTNELSLGSHLAIKSEYMAKSGANLAALLISADFAIDFLSLQPTGAKGNAQTTFPHDSLDETWAMLNGLPIGGETIEMVSSLTDSFDLSKVSDSKVLDQLKLFDGAFVINIEDEGGKLNLNNCGPSRGTECKKLLESLLSCPAEAEFLADKKIVINDLISMVRDWVDVDRNPDRGASYSSEDEPYADYGADNLPKNAYFDSLDELKMIPGWDDELHEIFSPYLTVYPKPTQRQKEEIAINVNTADRALMGCLFPRGTEACNEKAARHYYQRSENESTPYSSIGGITGSLSQNFCSSDSNKLKKLYTIRSDVFKVTVVGQVEDQKKTLEVVMKRGLPDEFDQRQGFNGTIKYLFWKML